MKIPHQLKSPMGMYPYPSKPMSCKDFILCFNMLAKLAKETNYKGLPPDSVYRPENYPTLKPEYRHLGKLGAS